MADQRDSSKVVDLGKARKEKREKESPYGLSEIQYEPLSSQQYLEVCAQDLMRILVQQGWSLTATATETEQVFTFTEKEYPVKPSCSIHFYTKD